jgi:cephalosporin hydroxylase
MSQAVPPSKGRLTQEQVQEVIRLANIIYFRSKAYERTEWMGIQTAKCPMDMWIYQQLMHQLKTDLLIETGTLLGGSALFFAQMFDLMGRGKVVTIDINVPDDLPEHPRIEYIKGSSVDPAVLAEVDRHAAEANSVMVILDSDHKAGHKMSELALYAKYVTRGSYLIAEDTCFDYYPAWPEFGPGPATAVHEFMQHNVNFEVDRQLEYHMITFAPMAFLRKK